MNAYGSSVAGRSGAGDGKNAGKVLYSVNEECMRRARQVNKKAAHGGRRVLQQIQKGECRA